MTYNRSTGDYLINYLFAKNDQYLTYERRVQTLSSAFSSLGGIIGLVQQVGELMVSLIEKGLFELAAVTKIFYAWKGNKKQRGKKSKS